MAGVETLQVIVSGGGPVGLSFALLLDHLLADRVAVTVYDERWMRRGSRTVWKGEPEGNQRRQQVVTIQSRQYLGLPVHVRRRLFADGRYSEMWPSGPDSIDGRRPRNLRVRDIEDALLQLAGERSESITLRPERFDPVERRKDGQQVLAICEGARSPTREHFIDRFGVADTGRYSLGGRYLTDLVLSMKVRSTLTDPMSVILTIAQNRFLLNSVDGEGYLNVRLTDAEAARVMAGDTGRRGLPGGPDLWLPMLEGVSLFGADPQEVTACTLFELGMVHRPRFTARLHDPSTSTPDVVGLLLGDAASSIHFWPGRGLNSGLASAISAAQSLADTWCGKPLREADLRRHEATMSMLQERHQGRAWKAMATVDESGTLRPIKDLIHQGQIRGRREERDRSEAAQAFMSRLSGIRDRLVGRIPDLPDDLALARQVARAGTETLETMLASGPWDTGGTIRDQAAVLARPCRPPVAGPGRVMSVHLA